MCQLQKAERERARLAKAAEKKRAAEEAARLSAVGALLTGPYPVPYDVHPCSSPHEFYYLVAPERTRIGALAVLT